MRISLRTFWVILLVVSTLWMLIVFVPLIYRWFSPPQELQAVIRALENRGVAPPLAVSVVEETIAAVGPLRRAVQIGYYHGGTITVRFNGKHTEEIVQTSYIAWSQGLPKPILLILERQKTDNTTESYRVAKGDAMGLVRNLALPCLVFAFAIVAVRWSKPKVAAV